MKAAVLILVVSFAILETNGWAKSCITCTDKTACGTPASEACSPGLNSTCVMEFDTDMKPTMAGCVAVKDPGPCSKTKCTCDSDNCNNWATGEDAEKAGVNGSTVQVQVASETNSTYPPVDKISSKPTKKSKKGGVPTAVLSGPTPKGGGNLRCHYCFGKEMCKNSSTVLEKVCTNEGKTCVGMVSGQLFVHKDCHDTPPPSSSECGQGLVYICGTDLCNKWTDKANADRWVWNLNHVITVN